MLFPSILPTVAAAASLTSSGTYDIYIHGMPHGSAAYRVEADTIRFENRLDLSPSSKGMVVLAKGRPVYAKLEVDGNAPAVSEIQIGSETRGRVGDRFEILKDAGGTIPYYTTHPYLLKFLLDKYGSKPSGFKSLPALDFAKLKLRSIEASFDRIDHRSVLRNSQTVRVWRIESSPNPESVVLTDEDNRPLEWWTPSLNFEMVLRGFETLRPSAPWEGKVSPTRYSVSVEKGVWTPLRNGLRLKADIYRPASPGRFPVVLQRSCYDRSEFGTADGEYFASRGYVYVTQNVRGRGGSEGPFQPEENEAEDGYDAVKWCATQPWSNGKVGMIGASYNGFCCWMAAKLKPKWLKTMVSVVPMAGAPDGEPWPGGTHFVGGSLSWYGLLRDPLKVQPFNEDLTKATNTLPISKSDEVGLGHHVAEWQKTLASNEFNSWLRKTSYRFEINSISIPVMHMDGWFDTVAVGTRLNYNQLKAAGNKNQKLIWGPWDHFTNRKSRVGDNDPGPQGYVPMQTTILRWFDRWLKGEQNGIDKEPSVDEFVLGANRWVKSNAWPPKNMSSRRWYLHEGKNLSADRPKSESPSKFVYDPAKWVADNNLQASFFFLMGSDAGSLCERPDVLTYESKPLARPVRLDGAIRGRLVASTSAKDTDWAMALLDVRPDGKAISLASGMVRARYRSSFEHPSLLKPGETVAYDIDMWQTGIQIPAGHKIRVVVLSTMFPDRDRNLNTGEPIANATRIVVAHQTIYHDRDRASYIELPMARPVPG